jgi:hypothetical protein
LATDYILAALNVAIEVFERVGAVLDRKVHLSHVIGLGLGLMPARQRLLCRAR